MIIKPGLLTTIQDTGRTGYQKNGIIVSGAMDAIALRLANILVGNNEREATLEVTLVGPSIHFHHDYLIAITGADLSPAINGKSVQLWKPIYVKKNSLLEFGSPKVGCRAYIAVSGGFAISKVMGSFSTYIRANIGGMNGRPLQADDTIVCHNPSEKAIALIKSLQTNDQPYREVNWALSSQLYPVYAHNSIIRAIKGPEYEMLTEDSKHHVWKEPFTVSHQSDRMGYRLKGKILSINAQTELISSAVTFGTVQLPSEGNPILLMADHQTTGGYPRIAQVITADFSKLAQVQPGKNIYFQEVSLQQAQQLYILQEQKLLQAKQALQLKFKAQV